MNGIRYFSMFTGVGGFELGLKQASDFITQSKNERSKEGREWAIDEPGTQFHNRPDTTFSCVGFSEIDKYANQLLAKRFPNVPNFGDCTKIEADKLPDFDMLCGGFPCQSFSIAGKRRGNMRMLK